MEKQKHLFIDQYGGRWYAATREDLHRQIPGRISPMYVDGIDGKTYRVGYVVGRMWLSEFVPLWKEV